MGKLACCRLENISLINVCTSKGGLVKYYHCAASVPLTLELDGGDRLALQKMGWCSDS